ncbi:MAG: DNA adenine methylase, partial [Candidatus Brocadiales bacterium]
MVFLKSPVNRLGGKYFLRHWIVKKMPEHTLYCEPFVGAGHLLFAKTPSKVEVINDTDNCLKNFFKIIKVPGTRQRLIEELAYMPYSRGLWQEIRQRWKQGNIPNDSIERAAMWFYLNKSTFSGDQKRGGFAIPSSTGRNTATTFRNTIESLGVTARRLKNITIENLDYKDCILKYDSQDSLFYCDPPYLDTEHYYGRGNFTHDAHYGLAELLHGVKGNAMVSHYQNGLYDD